MSKPTADSPAQVECVSCDDHFAGGCERCAGKDPECPDCHGDGKPCDACGGEGHHLITDCPHRLVDPATWEVLRMADMADKGAWPVAGGVGDQTISFRDAARYIWNESARLRAELEERRLGRD